MKYCPRCGNQLSDEASFCPNCGMQLGQAGQQNGTDYTQQPNVVMIAPYDHTREFDAKDVSDNKVYCMAIYLMGILGIIVGILASNASPYVSFHVRQALKISIMEILVGIVTLVLFWTILVPIAAAIFLAVLFVVRIICFVQIGQGKAVEPAIIRSIGFLK